ncbi:response regulator transcription factor [Streptomyces sp. NPDC006446]|uniref:response regulator transcription factor n=1 Tax=Streptomyces sp. NPDC006446 TaxID=3154301 RepID=UPI0033A39B63
MAKAINSEPGCELIAHAASGNEAMARVSPRRPAVILLDFSTDELMPVLLALRQNTPTTRLLAIGIRPGYDQAETVVLAAESGVYGFVDADQPLADVVGAIRLTAAGQSPCNPRIATLLLQALQRRPTPPPRPHVPLAPGHSPLTPRERAVAELAGRGLTNRQIASRLLLGESTVKTHVHSILHKLGIDRRDKIVLDGDGSV